MHHVTVVMCLFIVQEKKKEKENYIKRNIKSRKIDKKKRKILVFKYIIICGTNSKLIIRLRNGI